MGGIGGGSGYGQKGGGYDMDDVGMTDDEGDNEGGGNTTASSEIAIAMATSSAIMQADEVSEPITYGALLDLPNMAFSCDELGGAGSGHCPKSLRRPERASYAISQG